MRVVHSTLGTVRRSVVSCTRCQSAARGLVDGEPRCWLHAGPTYQPTPKEPSEASRRRTRRRRQQADARQKVRYAAQASWPVVVALMDRRSRGKASGASVLHRRLRILEALLSGPSTTAHLSHLGPARRLRADSAWLEKAGFIACERRAHEPTGLRITDEGRVLITQHLSEERAA